MRDHHDRASLLMKFAEEPQDYFFILRVKVAGGFVGENDSWIIDQSTSYADALLLSTGELGR
jgi:hypothetical protein